MPDKPLAQEIKAKSLLRKQKKIDSWFISRYNMNIYRGCTHNCVYCDGRTEKYQLNTECFDQPQIKINTLEILERETDPKRKRKPFASGFFLPGGGVGDSYQAIEKHYELTRKCLKLFLRRELPVHLLSKSPLILRDLDLIQQINNKKQAIVSFSFSTTDPKLAALLEPGLPPVQKRLEALSRIREKGLLCGAFLLPVVPFVTDLPERMQESISTLKQAGAEYIIFGPMTLKEGRQKEYFISFFKKHFPQYLDQLEIIYQNAGPWGNPASEYLHSLHLLYAQLMNNYKLPCRIPLDRVEKVLAAKERAIIMLEHLDYCLRLREGRSSYAKAAYNLSQTEKNMHQLIKELVDVRGIGKTSASLLKAYYYSGDLSYYQKMIYNKTNF